MKTQNNDSVKDQNATCDNNVLANRLLGNKENKYRIWDFSKNEISKEDFDIQFNRAFSIMQNVAQTDR